MRSDLLSELDAEQESRRASIVVTDIETGAQRLVREDDIDSDPLADELREQLRVGKSELIETREGTPVFLHVRIPNLRMSILGAVHVAQALVPLARLAGFGVTVIDPRSAFATPERFPDCEVIAEWPQQVLVSNPLDRYTAMVVLSHIPNIDDEGIKAALASECFYIGALGSRKTHAKRLDRLRAEGISESDLARIHAPIGLDIRAVSAPEIAISILAEIISVRRQKPSRGGPAA